MPSLSAAISLSFEPSVTQIPLFSSNVIYPFNGDLSIIFFTVFNVLCLFFVGFVKSISEKTWSSASVSMPPIFFAPIFPAERIPAMPILSNFFSISSSACLIKANISASLLFAFSSACSILCLARIFRTSLISSGGMYAEAADLPYPDFRRYFVPVFGSRFVKYSYL